MCETLFDNVEHISQLLRNILMKEMHLGECVWCEKNLAMDMVIEYNNIRQSKAL